MSIFKELKEKRDKGTELTEEELKFLTAYEEDMSEVTDKLNKEKTTEVNTLNLTKTQLQDRLNDIMSKYADLEKINKETLEEKEQLEKKIIDNSNNIEDIKIEIRESMDKKQKELLAKQEEENRKILESKELETQNKIKQLEELLKQQTLLNEKTQFISKLMSDTIEKPYMKKDLENLKKVVENDTESLDKVKTIYNYLMDSTNHEEELDRYKKSQEAGSNIFNPNAIKIKKNSEEEEFSKFLKENKL